MSTPWPDIAHTYDMAAGHYAATFAAELESAGLTIRERHERAPYPGEYPSPRLYLWAEVPLPG